MPSILSRAISAAKLQIGSTLKASASWFGAYESGNYSTRRSQVYGAPQDAKRDYCPHTRSEIVKNRRYIDKNSGFAREAKANMRMYSVGEGLIAQSLADETGNDGIRKQYEDYFRNWSMLCEVTGRFSFADVQALVCGAQETDGEHFALRTSDRFGRPKLQLVESHRVGDGGKGGSSDGILFDEYGTFSGIRVLMDGGKHEDVPAEAVMHVFEPEMVSLVRNPPTDQHSINNLTDVMEILALEKHAVKDNSGVVRIIKTENPDDDGTDEQAALLGSTEADGISPTALQKITGGKSLRVGPNDSIDTYESNRPSPAFNGFIEHLNRDSSLGLLPYEFVSDPSKVGGASVRLVVGKADRRFKYRQSVITNRLIVPTWAFVIGDGIARGLLPAVKDWHRVRVQTPRRVTVDAGREAAARMNEIATGTVTLEEDLAERGLDFDDHLEIRRDNMKKIRAAAQADDVPDWMYYGPQAFSSIYATLEAQKGRGATPVDGTKEEKE